MLRYTILLFTLLGSIALFGQKNAIITGIVTDSLGRSVEDAGVNIKGSDKGTFTAKNGSYSLYIPANTEVTLIFSHISAKSVVKTVGPFAPDSKNKLNISLDFKYFELAETEFEYERDRGLPIITLNPRVSGLNPNVSGNFESILRTLPGVTSNNELSSAYNVRGGNFDENLVYVNDIEIYRPQIVRSGQQEGLSFINPDMVESVRFSAGGFEAKYGDKLSSVLDVKYRKPEKFEAGANLNFMGAGLFAGGRSKRRLSWMLGSRIRSNQYILNSLDVQGSYKPLFVDVQGLFTYDISKKMRISYLGNYALNRFLLVPETQRTSFGTVTNALQLTVFFDGSELMRYNTFMNGLTFDWDASKNTNLKLLGSYYTSSETEYFTTEGAYRLDQLDNELGSDDFGQAKFNRGVGYFINHARNKLDAQVASVSHKGSHITKKTQLYWGATFQTESIKDRVREWYYVDSAGYSVPFNSGDTLNINSFVKGSNALQSQRISGYIQNTTMLIDSIRLQVTYGIRTNYWSLNQQNVISPRVQISFEPYRAYNRRVKHDSLKKLDWNFHFAFGYYYQPPFYRELRGLDGKVNTNVKAQRSIHYVFGGDMNFTAWGRPFKFYSEVYYKQLDNLVPYQIENVRIRYYANNNSKGRAFGWDARINGEFIEDLESWFSLSIMSIKENITYTDAKGVQRESGYIRRPTDQRFNLGIFFQDELDRWPRYKMQLNLVYGSNLPFYLGADNRYKEGFKLPAYRRIDIGFSRDIITEGDSITSKVGKWFKGLALSLQVFNLTQANNTISYIWVRDVEGTTFGVPNYLTSRRINLTVLMRF
ncbi:MAG: TonB-dependent receptor [Bacteroidota bacterium]